MTSLSSFGRSVRVFALVLALVCCLGGNVLAREPERLRTKGELEQGLERSLVHSESTRGEFEHLLGDAPWCSKGELEGRLDFQPKARSTWRTKGELEGKLDV